MWWFFKESIPGFGFFPPFSSWDQAGKIAKLKIEYFISHTSNLILQDSFEINWSFLLNNGLENLHLSVKMAISENYLLSKKISKLAEKKKLV